MRAELAGLNHCAVPLLSRAAAAYSCWYDCNFMLIITYLDHFALDPLNVSKDNKLTVLSIYTSHKNK